MGAPHDDDRTILIPTISDEDTQNIPAVGTTTAGPHPDLENLFGSYNSLVSAHRNSQKAIAEVERELEGRVRERDKIGSALSHIQAALNVLDPTWKKDSPEE